MSDISQVLIKLKIKKEKYAEVIITGEVPGIPKSEMACGMTRCPFHRWVRVTSEEAIDSVCDLPGDGGNVLACKPFWMDPNREVHYVHEGANHCAVARLPKCIQTKPISIEAQNILKQEKVAKEKEEARIKVAVADVVITPNRSSEQKYPNFMRPLMLDGKDAMPEKYTLNDLNVLSVSGSSKIVTGKSVVEAIQQKNLFSVCLNIHDCVAINSMGITIFRNVMEFLGLSEIHFWGSIITNHWDSEMQCPGELFVLRLREDAGSLKMEWVPVRELKWFKWCDVLTFKNVLVSKLA